MQSPTIALRAGLYPDHGKQRQVHSSDRGQEWIPRNRTDPTTARPTVRGGMTFSTWLGTLQSLRFSRRSSVASMALHRKVKLNAGRLLPWALSGLIVTAAIIASFRFWIRPVESPVPN